MIDVFLPSQLESYTNGVRHLSFEPHDFDCGDNETLMLTDLIQKLDTQYRGMAFRIVDEQGRIRRHIAIFIGENMVRELDIPLPANARVQIVGALSGG